MGRAIFVATDRGDRLEREDQLDQLVQDTKGVVDWKVHSHGEVMILYDEEVISANNVQEAIAGLGYEVKSVLTDPDASEASTRTVLTSDE